MPLIGYARVSTEDQKTDPQLDVLRAAGCDPIFEEHASGARTTRLQLEQALRRVRAGDTLVVVKIDRLARGLSHLLRVIEDLTKRGAYFRSLGDPIDTTTPQGRFSLQVLGAVAELERALARERTDAGLAAARARGRVGGNPSLKRRDPAAIAMLKAARAKTYLDDLMQGMDDWIGVVRRMRPAKPWQDVVVALNKLQGPPGGVWTRERLVRSVRRLAQNGIIERELLARAPNKVSRLAERAILIVSGMIEGNPAITHAEIARKLDEKREKPPRGLQWSISSVRTLLRNGRKLGLIDRQESPSAPVLSP